uniref:Tetraspanin n=1 Tax=Ciona intestinalis TaxID=7719 RepID=H2XRR2_CIOIN|nr:tetraspanin-3 [Ciona intestinalis]|eukprot:XP_002124911.2 tetraspanin-3 [Ciona intestinalis]
MGICMAPFKCVLVILNVLFWFAGAFMLYVGIKFIQDDNGYNQVGGRPAVILLCSASVLIVGGIIGCVGAMWEKKTCLGLFLVFLASVLIVQVAVTSLMFTNKKSMKSNFDDFLSDQFDLYGASGNDTVVVNNKTINPVEGINATEFIDNIQTGVQCCGLHNYTDWATFPWGENKTVVPVSCCKPQSETNTTCTGSTAAKDLHLIYQTGCEAGVNKAFYWFFDFLTWTALGLAILTFLGCCIVVGLLCYHRNQPIGYSHISPGYTEA